MQKRCKGSTKVDKLVQRQLPHVVVFLKEGSRDHVEHALRSEDFSLDVAEEHTPEEGEDQESETNEENDAQLYKEHCLLEVGVGRCGKRVIKTLKVSLVVSVGYDGELLERCIVQHLSLIKQSGVALILSLEIVSYSELLELVHELKH